MKKNNIDNGSLFVIPWNAVQTRLGVKLKDPSSCLISIADTVTLGK